MRMGNCTLCGKPTSQDIKGRESSEINSESTPATPESNPNELKRHAVYHAPEYIGKRASL